MTPHIKVVRFAMGEPIKKFQYTLNLSAKSELQIRQESIESARLIANKLLEEKLGKSNFFFQVRMYPHHVLRENPLASGAGADRMSTGMAKPFGKPIGVACRVKTGKILLTVHVDKVNIPTAKEALHLASTKLPCSCAIKIIEDKEKK